MLIRSQDKEMIVPLNRPIYAINQKICYGVEQYGANGIILGEYSSKPRCIEILDEIQAHVGEKTLYHGGVYQMPEK